ncbi:hypothetical protein GCM10009784_06350 [Arthrobacter parietis]|uniref:Uncharacterized protein n=1 Tax=Arthrobacter parietis TaxID=271434 RepID=A0ABN3AQB2_9MICC
MSKQEESWYSTSLNLGQIKQVLGSVLARAEISEMRGGPLNDLPEFAILAEQKGGLFKKPNFGNGLAAAQILVHDSGDHRRIQFVALGTSAGANLAGAWQVRNEGFMDRAAAGAAQPVLRSSKNLVAAVVEGLNAVDPQVQRVG